MVSPLRTYIEQLPLRVYIVAFGSDNISDERHAVHMMVFNVVTINAALQVTSL